MSKKAKSTKGQDSAPPTPPSIKPFFTGQHSISVILPEARQETLDDPIREHLQKSEELFDYRIEAHIDIGIMNIVSKEPHTVRQIADIVEDIKNNGMVFADGLTSTTYMPQLIKKLVVTRFPGAK